jgi:hypothetical protein
LQDFGYSSLETARDDLNYFTAEPTLALKTSSGKGKVIGVGSKPELKAAYSGALRIQND